MSPTFSAGERWPACTLKSQRLHCLLPPSNSIRVRAPPSCHMLLDRQGNPIEQERFLHFRPSASA